MAKKSKEPRELPRASETLRLLDELEAKGLSEAMFELLHHQGEEQSGRCLAEHRRYCDELVRERRGVFQSWSSQNATVQRRLQLLAELTRDTQQPDEIQWAAAIDETLRKLPVVKGRT